MGRRRDKVQTGKRRTVLQLDDTNAPRRDNYRGHYGYSSSRMDSTAFEQQNNKGASRLASLVGNYADSDDSAESEDDKPAEAPVDVPPPEPPEPKDAIDNEVASFLAEIDAISGDAAEIPVNGSNDGDGAKTTTNGGSNLAHDIPAPPTTFWQQCLDDDSQCYYYWHVDSNEVTWEIPAEFSEYLVALKEHEKDVKDGLETGRYKPASDPSEKEIDDEAATSDGKEDNIDRQQVEMKDKNTAPNSEKPVKSLVDYELTSPKIIPDFTHDATSPSSFLEASSRQKKKKSEKLPKNMSKRDDDDSGGIIGPQMPPKSFETKLFDKSAASGKTDPNVEDVDMFLSHLESEMMHGSSHVDNKRDNVKHGKPSDHHRKETDREERKRSRKTSDEHKDAAKKTCTGILESAISNLGNDPTDTVNHAKETGVSPELPAALIKKYQKKNKGKKSSTAPCDNTVQETTAASTPDDFDLDDIDRELEIALERKQAELRQMDDGEVVLENDEQRDIDNDEAENMVVNHEEEWVKETLTEDECEQQPDVISEADALNDPLSQKHVATPSSDDHTLVTESFASDAETAENPLLSSNDQDAHKADNSGDLVIGYNSPTKSTTADEKVDISKVIELTDMVMGKLDFLEISEQELSKLQILLLSIQTRAEDWNAGALSSDYYYSKLVEANQQLEQYELSAAPSGWECHWDRSYRRYFYLDKATGESQWDYPKVQEQLGSHEESGDVEIEESEMKVNGATEENKESDASSSSPKSETQKDSLSNNRSDDSRSPSRHRHRSRRYHKKHRKHKKRRHDSDSNMDSSESDYSSSDNSDSFSSTSSSDIPDEQPSTPLSEQPESRLSGTVSPTDMLDSQPPSLPDMRELIPSSLSLIQDDYQENDEGPPQLDKEPPPLPSSSCAPPPPADQGSPPAPQPPPPPPPPSEPPPPLAIHQPPPSVHMTSATHQGHSTTSFHLGQPPPPGTEELFMSLAPPPPPPPELVTVEMNAADDEPIEEVEMEGDEEVRTTTAPPPGSVIARSPQLNIAQPTYEGVIARPPQTGADYLSQGIIARGPQLASYAESSVSRGPQLSAYSEGMLAQGTTTYADGMLTSTVAAPAMVETNVTEPMIQQPVKEKKKKRDKSIANTNLAMKKRKVSSLVQKWQKVKKEVEQEEGLSDEDDRTGLVRQKIEEWRYEQMIRGDASDNPNFTEISGDWREKIRLRKLQDGSRAKDDYT